MVSATDSSCKGCFTFLAPKKADPKRCGTHNALWELRGERFQTQQDGGQGWDFLLSAMMKYYKSELIDHEIHELTMMRWMDTW